MELANVTNFTNFNATNASIEGVPRWHRNLAIAYKIILPTILTVIMVAMGCNVSLKEILLHVRRPVGFAIGAASQFVILPLLAFSLAHALLLEMDHAIGLLVIATCPGGTVSNIFAYWVKGDVSLSISMTTVATLLSFGTMPFNLWLYSRSWTSKKAAIPFLNIVITLASILGPVVVGMLIQWRSRKVAKIITQVGSITGIVCIVLAITIQTILYPQMMTSGWRVIVAAAVLPLSGFSISYLLAFICRRTHKICRTVAFETGFQNMAMAVGIINLSFDGVQSANMSLPCFIYATLAFVYAFIFVGVFCWVSKRQKQKKFGEESTSYVAVESNDKKVQNAK